VREEVGVDAIEPMTKMLMCGVVEVGVHPAAAKRNVASVTDRRVAHFASSAYGVET
jgi:hypothetical protein